jgi:cell division septation protein DedD
MAALIFTILATLASGAAIVACRLSMWREDMARRAAVVPPVLNPTIKEVFREERFRSVLGLLALLLTIIFTAMMHPSGVVGFLWSVVVVVICFAAVAMAVEWRNDVLMDWVWGKLRDPDDPDSGPFFGPAFLTLGGGLALLLVSVILAALFGGSDSSSSREVAKPPQTSAPSVTAEPTTASPSPTQTSASASPEPTPSETIASPTPTPVETTSPAPKPSPTTIQSDCGDVELFKNATTQDSDFGPGDVEVCLGGEWVEWSGTSPAKIRYNHSNKVGEYYYFLIERDTGKLLIRTTTVKS